MKKTIIVEILLLFVFCVAMAGAIKILNYAVSCAKMLDLANKINFGDEFSRNQFITNYKEQFHTALSYGVPALFAAVADLAAMVIIAIKDFPCFKPLVDKFKAYNEQRATAKAEQAATAKQERIEKLQAELDELKKDE